MSKQTLLTMKQQKEWLNNNWRNSTLCHKWSSRGYGNSKILNNFNEVIGKASGCGYDRFGAALGNAISELFPAEVLKLARRECKGHRRNYKGSKNFYGLFYDAEKGRAWLDGACGDYCMRRILNKIGFSLEYVGESERSNNGEVFYKLRSVSKNEREYLP